MKIGTRELRLNKVDIIIPRGSDEPIVFVAVAVNAFDEFDRICPYPKAPMIRRRGEEPVENTRDPEYLKKLAEYGRKKNSWMCIKSLETTPGLVWETVDPSDASTFVNIWTELEKAGFSVYEVSRIVSGVHEANGLDEDKIEAARKRFLSSGQQEADL